MGSKGGVYPCFIQNVGNVRENTLKELWNGETMRAFRQRRRKMAFEVCRGCCEMDYFGKTNTKSNGARSKQSDSILSKTSEEKTEIS